MGYKRACYPEGGFMHKYSSFSFVTAFFIATSLQAAPQIEFRKETCTAQKDGEPVVMNSDYSWHMSREDILAKQREIYRSGKRLQDRAYYDKTEDVIKAKVQTVSRGRQKMVVPDQILKSVRAHIESALKREYVDAIIFPDMGHSHYFIPQDFYDSEIGPLSSSEKALAYEKMLSHEGLKVLYHTAEQLKMIDPDDEENKLIVDRKIQWRFYTRNIVGDNKGQGHLDIVHNEEHSHNTARSYEKGYKYWGGGFYISASKDGCFKYTKDGEAYYFDMNFTGLAYDPSSGGYY